MDVTRLDEALAAAGMMRRGGFRPGPDDNVPAAAPGRPARTVFLVGNAGPALWRAFEAAGRDEADPLDGWTRRTLAPIAEATGARALFPFDGPPYLPFQRWAASADEVHVSPLGILVHPDFGLWHAYRGALAFAERLDLPVPARRPSPCETCADKPCLDACPVGAFTRAGYDVAACAGHIAGPAGAECMDGGCLARRACPVGRDHAYAPDQARFHMARFLAARRRAG